MLEDYSEFIRCAHCGEKVPKPTKSCHVFCPECGEELKANYEDDDMIDDYEGEADYSCDHDDDGCEPRRSREDWE